MFETYWRMPASTWSFSLFMIICGTCFYICAPMSWLLSTQNKLHIYSREKYIIYLLLKLNATICYYIIYFIQIETAPEIVALQFSSINQLKKLSHAFIWNYFYHWINHGSFYNWMHNDRIEIQRDIRFINSWPNSFDNPFIQYSHNVLLLNRSNW